MPSLGRPLDSATKRSTFGEANPSSMPFEIKHPITGCILQVAEEDFPSAMIWDDAMAACQKLGNDWRLPSLEELKAMHEQLHEHGKGNFRDSKGYGGEFYLSSSQDNSNNVWVMDFNYGYVGSFPKSYDYNVRAVRTLP